MSEELLEETVDVTKEEKIEAYLKVRTQQLSKLYESLQNASHQLSHTHQEYKLAKQAREEIQEMIEGVVAEVHKLEHGILPEEQSLMDFGDQGDEPRAVNLSEIEVEHEGELIHLDESTLKALSEVELTTIGELEDHMTKLGLKWWKAIKGISQGKSEHIENVYNAFRALNPHPEEEENQDD